MRGLPPRPRRLVTESTISLTSYSSSPSTITAGGGSCVQNGSGLPAVGWRLLTLNIGCIFMDGGSYRRYVYGPSTSVIGNGL